MELPRTQPYASLLKTPYSTVRSSLMRTMSNYKMTSTSWWTGIQQGVWNLTQQRATSCTSLSRTRKKGMRFPLYHGCSHTWEGLRQQMPRRHTQQAPQVVYAHSDDCRKAHTMHFVFPLAQHTGPTASQVESLPCHRAACTWVCLSNHWPSPLLWHQAPRLRPATCCSLRHKQPTKKIRSWTRPSQYASPDERPWMGRPRYSSQKIKMYHDVQDTEWSCCHRRGFEAPILQGQPALCFTEQAAAHQVQIYSPSTFFLPTHHQGLESPSPDSEDCILTWGVQGGPPPVIMHQRLF